MVTDKDELRWLYVDNSKGQHPTCPPYEHRCEYAFMEEGHYLQPTICCRQSRKKHGGYDPSESLKKCPDDRWEYGADGMKIIRHPGPSAR
jgi:hypothetical protein